MTSSERSAPPGAAHPVHVLGLCLAAVAVPLAWSTHFVAEYTLTKLWCLNLGLAVAALGAAVRAPRGGRTALDVPIALNLLALGLSCALSQDPRLSVFGRYNSYSHGLWVCLAFAALAWGGAWLASADVRRVAGVLLAGGALVAAYACAQVAGYEPFLRGALPAGSRAVSTIGSPVDLGAFLAMLVPLAAAWTLRRNAVFGGLAFAAVAGGLWATSSRGAWLGALVGLAVFAALARPSDVRERLRRVPAWAAALAVALLLGAGGLAVRRLASRSVRESDTSRVEVWRTAWHTFLKRPWIGSGPDTFEQTFRRDRTEEFVRRIGATVRFQAYAHDDLLQSLSTTGVLGAAAYVYLLVAIALVAWTAVRRSSDAWLAAGLAGGLAATFVVVKFDPVALEVMAQTSLFAGLLAALEREAAGPPARPVVARAAAGVAAALAIAGLAWATRWGLADLEAKYAQVEYARGHRDAPTDHIRLAALGDPCEVSYRVTFMNHVGELINADKTPADRLALLQEALAAGNEAVRCHPNEVNAHYALGVAAWLHVQLGLPQYLEVAERELDRALELDPMFLPLLETRLMVAHRRGGPDAARIQARIAAVHRLAPF